MRTSVKVKHLRNINIEPKILCLTLPEIMVFAPVSYILSLVIGSIVAAWAATLLGISFYRLRGHQTEEMIRIAFKKRVICFKKKGDSK